MGNESATEQNKTNEKLHHETYNENDAEFKIDNNNKNQQYQFSVCSFNIWCPLWNDANGVEAKFPDRWMKRHNNILNVLCDNDKMKVDNHQFESINADIYCLQEYWCQNKAFLSLYTDYFNDKHFGIHYLKRSAARKPDGVAIIYNKSVFKLINKTDIEYTSSNRVAIIMELQHIQSGLHMNIGNTHFTFPNGFNASSRKALCSQLVDIMEKNTSNNTSLMILCGDYNCDIHETECIMCLNKGYKSSFHIVNKDTNGECVSHLTHKNQSVFVDHIFYKGNTNVDKEKQFGIKPIEACLYPPNVAITQWPNEKQWNLSDHRPLVTKFRVQKQ